MNKVGREIMDIYVMENKMKNLALYAQIENNPGYYGNVNIDTPVLELTGIKNKKDITPARITDGIIQSAKHMVMNAGDVNPHVVLISGEQQEIHSTCADMIAFIKCCVAGSYTTEMKVSEAVSKFVLNLIPRVDALCLPISVDVNDVIGKEVVKELNDYLREICESNNIRYTEEVVGKVATSKKSLSYMLKDAEG